MAHNLKASKAYDKLQAARLALSTRKPQLLAEVAELEASVRTAEKELNEATYNAANWK